MAEGGGLLNRYTLSRRIEGSNPSVSAIPPLASEMPVPGDELMSSPSALACIRCGTRYAIEHYASDCSACRSEGAPANLTVVYDDTPGQALDRKHLGTFGERF